jgi:hypothetical protein
MDHLQACYFCGVAEADSLREVTVFPRRRQDDPEAKVSLTLCRSCETKLERVLDGLFEHVESRQSTATTADHATQDETTTENQPIDRVDIGAERSANGTPGAEPTSVSSSPPDGDEASTSPTSSATVRNEGTSDAAEPEKESGVTARATMNPTDGLDEISVDEYNRVIRLLQNRELPIDRDAFVQLATNAYEMREGTVEALLDQVIEKGSLAVSDGELVRPDASI